MRSIFTKVTVHSSGLSLAPPTRLQFPPLASLFLPQLLIAWAHKPRGRRAVPSLAVGGLSRMESLRTECEGAWAALVAQLPLGPAQLASHPSAAPLLSISLPGLGPRSSDAVARTAVSLAFLRAFKNELVLPLLGPNVSTKEVVERLVKPLAANEHCLASRLPAAAVGAPTAFVSHAWGTCHYGAEARACGCSPSAGSFALLVDSVSDFFAGAVETEVFVWLDVFAVDQHDETGSELDGGLTLRKTVDLAAHTLVVLERGSTLTLSRLWCLYEVGTTPPEKLQLLTRGFAPAELTAKFRGIDVAAASCWDRQDGYFDAFIRSQIRQEHGSQELFEQKLKLRLLLRPTSYEADLKALLAKSTDAWCFEELRHFVQNGDGLACVAGGPGEGKSTIAAALCCGPDSLVHAWHFCKASDVTRQDVGEIIRSLAYQLATAREDATTLRFPEFAHALLELDDSALEELGEHSKAFQRLLKEPLLSLPAGTRVVLLFDALDEAETPTRSVSKLLNILLDLGRLGNNAPSVIVTTRPESVIVDALQARWRDGFRTFLPGELRSASCEDLGQSKLCRFLQSRIASATAANSVDDLYFCFFSAALSFDCRLIDILLAAREPPSLMLLEELGVRSQLERLPGWGVLFYERDYCVHVLHRSLSEWLLDQDRSGVYAAHVASGHVAWSDLLSAQLSAWMDGSGRVPVSGHYLYRNLLAHHDACGRGEQSRQLLMRLPWLQATLRERGVWALIREVAARARSGDGSLDTLRRLLLLSAERLQGADTDTQLLSHIIGGLGWLEDNSPELARLVSEARAWREKPWLCPLSPSFQQPMGAVEMTLTGKYVAVAPTGNIILTPMLSSQVEVWNAESGERDLVICGDQYIGEARAVAVAQDGRIIVGYGEHGDDGGGVVRLWNATTGECELLLVGHTHAVTTVFAHPDGRIISGSNDKALRLWNASTGECELILKGHTSSITSVAVADGRVASGSEDTTVRRWNLTTGKCDRVLQGHTNVVTSVAGALNGRIISGSLDETVRVWYATMGECERVLQGHKNPIHCVAIAPNGRILSGSGSLINTVRVWNMVSGACEHEFGGHRGCVLSIATFPDGRIVSGDGCNTVRLWNPAACGPDQLVEQDNHIAVFVAAPHGRIFTSTCDWANGHALQLWNAASGECELELKGHKMPAMAVIFTSSGQIVTAADERLLVWNPGTRACERVLKDQDLNPSILATTSLDGQSIIVSGSMSGTVKLWNASTGACDTVLAGHSDMVSSLAATPDRIVAGSSDGSLRVWKISTGDCELVLHGHSDFVHSVAITPCDERIVSSSSDGTWCVWNMSTGERERVMNASWDGDKPLMAVAADGNVVVGNTNYVRDGLFTVYDAATGSVIHGGDRVAYSALLDRNMPGHWHMSHISTASGRILLPIIDGGRSSIVIDTANGRVHVVLSSDDDRIHFFALVT